MRDHHAFKYPTPDEIEALHRRVRRLRAEAMRDWVWRFGRWLARALAARRGTAEAAAAARREQAVMLAPEAMSSPRRPNRSLGEVALRR